MNSQEVVLGSVISFCVLTFLLGFIFFASQCTAADTIARERTKQKAIEAGLVEVIGGYVKPSAITLPTDSKAERVRE